MRFCEAVAKSRTSPLLLTPESLSCPGAMRSFGWDLRDDTAMAELMAQMSDLEAPRLKELIFNVPRLHAAPRAIEIGDISDPDVALTFAQPGAVMGFVRLNQTRNARPIAMPIQGIMTICGGVAVQSHLSNQMTISFGCPESRRAGGIPRDRLALGLSRDAITSLLGIEAPAGAIAV